MRAAQLPRLARANASASLKAHRRRIHLDRRRERLDRHVADDRVLVLIHDRQAQRFEFEVGLAKINPVPETDCRVHRACVIAPGGVDGHIRIMHCPIQKLPKIGLGENGQFLGLVVHQFLTFGVDQASLSPSMPSKELHRIIRLFRLD